MANDNQVSMPQGRAGITQYSDESTSNVQVSPKMIVVGVAIFAIIMLAIRSGLLF